MSKKIFIVIEREFMTRVRKKSFILLTILTPILLVALIATPLIMGMVKDDAQQRIMVVDTTHRYIKAFTDTERFHFDFASTISKEYRSDSSDYQALVYITDNLCDNPHAATIYSHEEVQLELRQTIESILSKQIREDKLARYNMPQLEDIIKDVQQDFSVNTVKWDADGEERISSADIAMSVGLIFTFLIYAFVMSYGGMVMSGVMEEKNNRIIEVMVSSIPPFQLMMGKIIGVFLVGLLQVIIWGLLLGGVGITAYVYSLAHTPVEATLDPGIDLLSIAQGLPLTELAVMFMLCFMGGYILYASIFAACGAAINSQEDSSQFMMPIMILMIFALYTAMGSMENTNGPLAFWTSLFPLTSPVVMMVRIPFGVPLWQELLSLALLYATAIGSVWVGARIYRVGILMYGKKPTFSELWKWLHYK